MRFSSETLRSRTANVSSTGTAPRRNDPLIVCANRDEVPAIESAVTVASALTTAATFRTGDPETLLDIIFACRSTVEPSLMLLVDRAVGGDPLAVCELVRSWEWTMPLVVCSTRRPRWRERAAALDVVLIDRSAALRALPVTVRSLIREGTLAVRCAACASCANPTPFSDDAVGYFCIACRSQAETSDLDDPWIDFGVGD